MNTLEKFDGKFTDQYRKLVNQCFNEVGLENVHFNISQDTSSNGIPNVRYSYLDDDQVYFEITHYGGKARCALRYTPGPNSVIVIHDEQGFVRNLIMILSELQSRMPLKKDISKAKVGPTKIPDSKAGEKEIDALKKKRESGKPIAVDSSTLNFKSEGNISLEASLNGRKIRTEDFYKNIFEKLKIDYPGLGKVIQLDVSLYANRTQDKSGNIYFAIKKEKANKLDSGLWEGIPQELLLAKDRKDQYLGFVPVEGNEFKAFQELSISTESVRASEDKLDDVTKAYNGVSYWAGGFVQDDKSRLQEFIDNDYWDLGWTEDHDEKGAKIALGYFNQIKVGDWFAIKGYGGSHDLKIHYVGEVISVDFENRRLKFKKLNKELYSGKAPKGKDAGNWFNAIVPLTRPDVIDLIFGDNKENDGLEWKLKNLKYVLVTGSLEADSNLIVLAEKVGDALAKNGFGLIVGTFPGVDKFVAESYFNTLLKEGTYQAEKLIYYGDLNREVNNRPTQGHVWLITNTNDLFSKPVEGADAVIVLGGNSNPAARFRYNNEHNLYKPFFVYPNSNQSSDEIHKEIISDWAAFRTLFNGRINLFDFQFLEIEVDNQKAANLWAEYSLSLLSCSLNQTKAKKVVENDFSEKLADSLYYLNSLSKHYKLKSLNPEFILAKLINLGTKRSHSPFRWFQEQLKDIFTPLEDFSFIPNHNFNENKSFSGREVVNCDSLLHMILGQCKIFTAQIQEEKIREEAFYFFLLLYTYSLISRENEDIINKLKTLIELYVQKASEISGGEIWIYTWQRFLSENKNGFNRFHSDSLSSKDALGVKHDAEGIARLIMDKKFEGSLAVGVFGPWGSGKSNFFEFLKDEVKDICESEEEIFCKEVCHIDFNAWHYHDSNLWASILVQIFDNLAKFYAIKKLKKSPDDQYDLTDKQIAESSSLLESKLLKTKSELQKIEENISEKNDEILKIEEEIESKTENIETLRTKDSASIISSVFQQNNFHTEICEQLDIKEDLDSLEEAKEEFKNSSNNVILALKKFFDIGKKHKKFFVAFFILFSLIVTTITLALKSLNIDLEIKSLVSFPCALYLSFKVWIGYINGCALKISEVISLINSKVDKLKNEDLSEFSRKKDQLRKDLLNLEERKSRLRLKKTLLEKDKSNLTPFKQIHQFIENRFQSGKFKDKLGLVSEIRQELERLERLMKRTKDCKYLDKEKELKKLDRIILYIDDLDRCEKEIVLEVLQAIHLLLGFELFVVVVGVDTRWVLNALSDTYFLNGSGDDQTEALKITPKNYLEKIFQIPYCLPVINDMSLTKLMEGIPYDEPVKQPTIADNEKIKGKLKGGSNLEDSEPVNESSEYNKRHENISIKSHSEVVLTKSELDLMKSRVLPGITPRVYKRLVNVYRIIRSSLNNNLLNNFKREDYKLVWFLLCIQAERRDSYHSIFIRILKNPSDKILESNGFSSVKIETLKFYIQKVCQFSFDTEKHRMICNFIDSLSSEKVYS